MLMPAAVLVVVILGGIAVDSAVVFTAQRELVSAAQAAANDAVAYGIDEGAFRAVAATSLTPLVSNRPSRTRSPCAGSTQRHRWYRQDNRIVVELEEDVAPVFARAIPVARRRTVVRARAAAALVDQG